MSEKEALVCSLNKAVLRSREEARLAEAKTREKETLLAELLSFEVGQSAREENGHGLANVDGRLVGWE